MKSVKTLVTEMAGGTSRTALPTSGTVVSSDQVNSVRQARVEGHYVTLEARSDALDLEPAEIPLAEAGVTTYRGRFRERPDLRVTAVLPEGLRGARCQIEVYTAAGRSLIREAFLDSETAETVVEDLPGETLHVKLIADRWPFFEAVDLSDGEDDTVIFAPKPLRVTGQVLLGEDGVLSELSFRQGRGPELAAGSAAGDVKRRIGKWRGAASLA